MTNAAHDVHTLTWHGPFTFRDLLLSSGHRQRFWQPGVYVWTIVTPTGQTLNYVGKAEGKPTLWHRQFDHYVRLIGGDYELPGCPLGTDNKWGMDYTSPTCLDVVFDPAKFKQVVDFGFTFANQIRIYLAPVNQNSKAIEGQLLYDLNQCSPLSTTRGIKRCPATRKRFAFQNASWASAEVRSRLGRITTIVEGDSPSCCYEFLDE